LIEVGGAANTGESFTRRGSKIVQSPRGQTPQKWQKCPMCQYHSLFTATVYYRPTTSHVQSIV